MKESITTIQVSRRTRDRLAAKAVYGDSLDDVIAKMLDKEETT